MGDWEADVYEQVDGRSVYLWIVPAKVDVRWSVKDGTQTFDLKLDQRFQMFTGTATVGGKDVTVKDGKLNGAQIVFTLDLNGKPVTFEGKVSGDIIEGTAGKREWSAAKKS